MDQELKMCIEARLARELESPDLALITAEILKFYPLGGRDKNQLSKKIVDEIVNSKRKKRNSAC